MKLKGYTVKRFVSAALAVIIAVSLGCVSAFALRGSWNGVSWDITDGVLTVGGGDIPDLTASSSAPWAKFADDIKAVVIDSGVGYVGERAFEDMHMAVSVDLGGVTEIGTMAFSGCVSLKEVIVPGTVKSIGDFAFAECVKLSKVKLSAGVQSIGEGVFESCPMLAKIESSSAKYPVTDGVLIDKDNSSILRYPSSMKGASYTVPAGITKIESGAFREVLYLCAIDTNGVTIICDGAFFGCVSLESVTMPAVKTVGRAVFYGCENIAGVVFAESVTMLGDNAFSGCSSLASARFSGKAPAMGDDVFHGCSMNFTVIAKENATGFGDTDEWHGYPLLREGEYSGEIDGVKWSLDSATGLMTVSGSGSIPDFEYASDAPWYKYRRVIRELKVSGIIGIGNNAFRYASLETVVLASSVKDIGEWAFSGCSYLREVTANGVTSIGKCAFFGDTSLLHVRVVNVKNIEDQAFSGCDALVWVYMGKTAPTVGEYVFDSTDASVIYPIGGSGYAEKEWDGVHTEPYFAGDANGDGKCNLSDVSLLMKAIAKWSVSLNRVSADVNSDGKLSLADASMILKYIAKWDVDMGIK